MVRKVLLLLSLSALALSGCSLPVGDSAPPYSDVVRSGSKLLQQQSPDSARVDLAANFTLQGQRVASSDLAPLLQRDISLALRGPISKNGSMLQLQASLGSASGSAMFYSGSKNAVRLDGRWYEQESAFFRSPLRTEALVTRDSWGDIFTGLGSLRATSSGQDDSAAGPAWVYTLQATKSAPDLGPSRAGQIAEEMIEAGATVEVGYRRPDALPVMLRFRGDIEAASLAGLLGLRGKKDLPGVSRMEGEVSMSLYSWGLPLPLPPRNTYSREEGKRLLGWEFLPLWTEGSG